MATSGVYDWRQPRKAPLNRTKQFRILSRFHVVSTARHLLTTMTIHKGSKQWILIYCKVDDNRLFLWADSKDESKVCLVTSVPYPNAYTRLYVEFPSTRRLAALSCWTKYPLHVLRKTAYMKRRQYLVIDTQTRQLSFTWREPASKSKSKMSVYVKKYADQTMTL